MKDIYKHPDHHQQSNKLQNIQVWDTTMYSLHFIQHTYGEKTRNTYPSNFEEYGLGNHQFKRIFRKRAHSNSNKKRKDHGKKRQYRRKN